MKWIHYESRNFTFDAFGKDEREAWLNMRAGIRKHGEQYSIDPTSLGVEIWKEAYAVDLKDGFYRDNEKVKI